MNGQDIGAVGALQEGVDTANGLSMTPEDKRLREEESNAVKKLWDDYDKARMFDKDARAQYAVDRRYAAGTANLNWAVSANLIGAFIDILVSFLYARNPDVSIRKAPRVNNSGSRTEDDMAKTLELIVSALWRAPNTRLKMAARAQVRSALTNGVGWLKTILVSQGTNIPEMKSQLNDTRDNIAQLEAARLVLEGQPMGQLAIPEPAPMDPDLIEYDNEGNVMPLALAPEPIPAVPMGIQYQGDTLSQEEYDAKMVEYQQLEQSIQTRMEVAIRKALAVDFVAPEDMQVSLDVRNIADYPNANWVANAIYRPCEDLCAMFPKLTKADAKAATQYFQRRNMDCSPLGDRVALTGVADASVDPEEAEQYSKSSQTSGTSVGEEGLAFAKVVELWNRRTGHVHTMIEGIKVWAKAPYQPDYPSSRFYPYFSLSFYSVDGARHPQSLPYRLMKLQDEYASVRSSQRLVRQRAAPGIFFDATNISPDDARKIEGSTYQEYVGIKPVDPNKPFRDSFAEKPVASGDPRLYDTSSIMADMERIAGVQEALQSSALTPKTATEAEIQQTGFASRTTADRDSLETMLTEMAQYTAELALSGISGDDATRMVGSNAFWPEGMAVDDLLTMVEIEIAAGTTGKPRTESDKNAWGILLPLIQEAQLRIQEAQLTGNLPLAEAISALLRETMVRMGDDTDVEKFIPQMPDVPPGGLGLPGAAGAAGAPLGAPGEIPIDAGVPAGDGLLAPELIAPLIENPIMEPPIF